MKKSGFTLAELIAVLVILSLIAVITVPEVTRVIKENRIDACGIQLNNIKEAAVGYLSNNIDMIPMSYDECYSEQVSLGKTSEEAINMCIDISKDIKVVDLIKYGYIDNDLINPNTGEAYGDDFYVKVIKNGMVLEYDIYEGYDANKTLIETESFCN